MGAFVLSSAVQRCAEQLMARRKVLLGFFLLLTLALGYSATQVRLDPGFNKQIPVHARQEAPAPGGSRFPSGSNQKFAAGYCAG